MYSEAILPGGYFYLKVRTSSGAIPSGVAVVAPIKHRVQPLRTPWGDLKKNPGPSASPGIKLGSEIYRMLTSESLRRQMRPKIHNKGQ